jgi:Tetratricopeptide repeat
MDFDPAELDTLSREDLILRARARGVERPEQMTRVELRDEIVRRSEPDLERQRRSRGWLGVARDLLASVVESGLNLPDAAAAIRGDGKGEQEFQGPPPVATVTLAEIYAAQGHYEQALRMLDEVIEREPEHATARSLRERIAEERDLGPGRRRKVVETKAETIVTPQPPPVAVASEPPPQTAPVPTVPDPPRPTPVSAPAAAAPVPLPVPVPDAPAPIPATAREPAPEPAAPEPAPARSQPALVVLQTSDRAFVYWRLPAVSPSLLLRSVTVRPEHQGASVEECDYPLPLATGGFWLSRLAPGSEVRAAVGELSPHGFTPLAVARVLDGSDGAAFEPLGVEIEADLETAARNAAGL